MENNFDFHACMSVRNVFIVATGKSPNDSDGFESDRSDNGADDGDIAVAADDCCSGVGGSGTKPKFD